MVHSILPHDIWNSDRRDRKGDKSSKIIIKNVDTDMMFIEQKYMFLHIFEEYFHKIITTHTIMHGKEI